MTDYDLDRIQAPRESETARGYCARLEAAGYEEMIIRKGLAQHFEMPIDEMSVFLADFPAARLRHIGLLLEIAPNRSEYSLIVKVAKNLGLSRETAKRWVEAFRAS
jgi:hypothetical protein